MFRKTLCAIVAATIISGCQPNVTQQLNPPGIEISIGDLKGCWIEANDRDGDGALDLILTSQALGENFDHKIHDMTSFEYKSEVLHQLQAIHPIMKDMFYLLKKYEGKIASGTNFDDKDNGKKPKIKTNAEGSVIFKRMYMSFGVNQLVIYDWNYDGNADMIIYKIDEQYNPKEMSQCHFSKGFGEMCKSNNKIEMSEEMKRLANESLNSGLMIFSKFEKNKSFDKEADDSYFLAGVGWRSVMYYNFSNIR